jgi:hypothetical protein
MDHRGAHQAVRGSARARAGPIAAAGAGGGPFNPLSIAWDHAYWTGGPNFLALGLANNAQVSPWPDEAAAAANLAQATATKRPLFIAANAAFNNHGTIRFDGADDELHVDFTDMALPYETYVVLKKIDDTSTGGNNVVFDSYPGGSTRFYAPGNWDMFGGNIIAGSVSTGDNALHTWRHTWVAGPGQSTQFKDEVQNAIGNAAPAAMQGLILGCRVNLDRFGHFDFAFFGIKSGTLSVDDRTNLHAWAQATYGAP